MTPADAARRCLDAALASGDVAALLVAADACAEAGDGCGEAFCRHMGRPPAPASYRQHLGWLLAHWRSAWASGWRPAPGV